MTIDLELWLWTMRELDRQLSRDPRLAVEWCDCGVEGGTAHAVSPCAGYDFDSFNYCDPANEGEGGSAGSWQIHFDTGYVEAQSRDCPEGTALLRLMGLNFHELGHVLFTHPEIGFIPISRFFSYVAAAGSREARMAERQVARAIKLGEHGVDRVVEYEAARGRTAEPQPHNNKGFDIISYRPDGSDRRIIEVKATARDWPDRGVPVSDSQIDKNRELGDEFWLYVVEHPEDPEQARVTAIQNPIASADYFAFDPGWRALGDNQSAE